MIWFFLLFLFNIHHSLQSLCILFDLCYCCYHCHVITSCSLYLNINQTGLFKRLIYIYIYIYVCMWHTAGLFFMYLLSTFLYNSLSHTNTHVPMCIYNLYIHLSIHINVHLVIHTKIFLHLYQLIHISIYAYIYIFIFT